MVYNIYDVFDIEDWMPKAKIDITFFLDHLPEYHNSIRAEIEYSTDDDFTNRLYKLLTKYASDFGVKMITKKEGHFVNLSKDISRQETALAFNNEPTVMVSIRKTSFDKTRNAGRMASAFSNSFVIDSIPNLDDVLSSIHNRLCVFGRQALLKRTPGVGARASNAWGSNVY